MVAVPKPLLVIRELPKPLLADDVFDADQACSRLVGIEYDALMQIVLKVNTEVMRLDLPTHIVSVEMKPVQEGGDSLDRVFRLHD
jgi:hypothetical protein